MKCNQSRPGFEHVSPCPFPTMITITPLAPPKIFNIKWCHCTFVGSGLEFRICMNLFVDLILYLFRIYGTIILLNESFLPTALIPLCAASAQSPLTPCMSWPMLSSSTSPELKIFFCEKCLNIEKYFLYKCNFKRFMLTFLFWSGLFILSYSIQFMNINDHLKSCM